MSNLLPKMPGFTKNEKELMLSNEDMVKTTMQGPFPTFYAVEDPLMVLDAVPRDLRSNASKTNSMTSPFKTGFQLFETFEAATHFAQKQNRPLLILEMKVSAKVLPQLPLVEQIKAA